MTKKNENSEKNDMNNCKCASSDGLISGLVPHIGCIAFILFVIIGATTATTLLKPLLANQYFFPILIGFSFLFATATAAFYLKKRNSLSLDGAKKNSSYLLTLYGTTAITNALFLFFIFPAATNMIYSGSSDIGTNNQSGMDNSTKLVTLKVAVPCSGHAPLIIDELKKVDGIRNVKYHAPDVFVIECDSNISEDKILSQSIFLDFKASVVK